MLGELLRGLSTREHGEVPPQLAVTANVSHRAFSRQAIEAGAEQLQSLRTKRWESVEILVLYIDGERFGRGSGRPQTCAGDRSGRRGKLRRRLNLPPSLHNSLAATNFVESPQGGVPRRTENVTLWRNADMVERWVASARLLTEKRIRKIDGHQHLWALAVVLGRQSRNQAHQENVA